jgi:O-antigen/teichoic acid export membrane protein
VLTVCTTVANLLGYALTLIAARALGPEDFGAFASLLGLLVIGNVVALGVQTTTARHLAEGDHVQPLTRTALTAAVLATTVGLALSWPMQQFLRLDSIAGPVAIAVALAPLTWLGYLMGLAQGRRDFARLAGIVVLTAAGRTTLGAVGALMGSEVLGAVGMAAGLGIAAVVASFGMHPPGPDGRGVPTAGLVQVAHASHTLFAFFVLGNMDVLLARNELSETSAGLYAVGAIVAKVAFWLPQAVGMVAFPDLVDPRSRGSTLRVASLALLAIGAVLTLGTAVLGRLAVLIVGGADYVEISSTVWVWAAFGSTLAIVNLLVLAQLARRSTSVVWVLWGGVAMFAAAVLLGPTESPTSIAATGLGVAAGVSVVELVALRGDLQRTSGLGQSPGM